MSKKSWTGGKASTTVSMLGASNRSDMDRVENDYYATNPEAIDDLFEVEDFDGRIWEPACGGGHLSKRMEEHGKDVYSTDIVNRGFGNDFFDFLKSDKEWEGDIITNPPYKHAKDFVLKSLELVDEGNKVAMFMKITFLEGVTRAKELFKHHPPKKVWIYSFRQTIARNGNPEMFEGASAVCYCWFVWEKGYCENPKIGWITKSGQLDLSEPLRKPKLSDFSNPEAPSNEEVG